MLNGFFTIDLVFRTFILTWVKRLTITAIKTFYGLDGDINRHLHH